MDLKLFEANLTHLDHHSLERIATIAAQARRSLLIGIASIRGADDTTPPPETTPQDTDLMIAQLGRLTLMWDEIHHRANRLLSDEPVQTEEWPDNLHKTTPVTLH